MSKYCSLITCLPIWSSVWWFVLWILENDNLLLSTGLANLQSALGYAKKKNPQMWRGLYLSLWEVNQETDTFRDANFLFYFFFKYSFENLSVCTQLHSFHTATYLFFHAYVSLLHAHTSLHSHIYFHTSTHLSFHMHLSSISLFYTTSSTLPPHSYKFPYSPSYTSH